MDEQEYDAAVEQFREATRNVLAVGNDDPSGTADDLKSILEQIIEEEKEG